MSICMKHTWHPWKHSPLSEEGFAGFARQSAAIGAEVWLLRVHSPWFYSPLAQLGLPLMD